MVTDPCSYNWRLKRTNLLLAANMGRLDGIQTALNPLIKIEKIEINLHDHLEPAESFKMINRPDPTVIRILTACFSGSIEYKDVKF